MEWRAPGSGLRSCGRSCGRQKSQRLRGRVQVADSQGTPEFRDSHLRICETNFAHAHLQNYRIAGDLKGE